MKTCDIRCYFTDTKVSCPYEFRFIHSIEGKHFDGKRGTLRASALIRYTLPVHDLMDERPCVDGSDVYCSRLGYGIYRGGAGGIRRAQLKRVFSGQADARSQF